MRVAVVGRTYLLRHNRAKWNYVPEDIALSLVTPPRVRHVLRTYPVEQSQRWSHAVVPAWMVGRLSAFGFRPLPLLKALNRARPHLIQVDEEPSSLALLEVLLLRPLWRSRVILFSWENQITRYPLPFRWIRHLNLRLVDGAIVGSREAGRLLHLAGFRKPMLVLPQLGIDADRFFPQRSDDLRRSLGLSTFTVGYVGRLVPEKGLALALQALATLEGPWEWLVVGRGPMRAQLEQQAAQMGVSARLNWVDTVAHEDIPRYLNAMDVLVLPSQSTPRWKEQFGHVLIEAMACGVPVIGSDSGAIPEVIGDSGLVFPEGRADLLAVHLRRLQEDPVLRTSLGQRGRKHVLTSYTDRRIAERTTAFWREVCPCA